MNATEETTDKECFLPLHTRIIGIIVVIIIMLVGAIGNILVCFIIRWFKTAFESISYLFVINVAISDFFMSVTVLPFDIIYWLSFPVFSLNSNLCRLWNAFYFTFLTASSIGIYLLGIDIYLAVTKPLHYDTILTRRRAFSLITAQWLWSITIGLLIYFYQTEPPVGEYMFDLNPIAYGIYLAVHIIIPSVIIPFIYAKIFVIARRHQKKICPVDATVSRAEFRSDSQEKRIQIIKRQFSMAKMFCFITVNFFLLWYPFLVVQMFYVLKLDSKIDWCKLETADTIVCWLSYIQCCTNPIFYVFRRKKIRNLVTNRLTKRVGGSNISEATKMAVGARTEVPQNGT
eukprot:gene7002-7784_t